MDQVVIRTGADIAHLPELDQKLWVALSCPTRGLEFDTRTLDCIDTDRDGRIRPPELLAACEWACRRLRTPDELAAPSDVLSLDAFSDAGEGQALAEHARQILLDAQKEGERSIALSDVLAHTQALSSRRWNGDGVIDPSAAEDDADVRQTIEWIVKAEGTAEAASGQPAGINRALAERFFAHVDKLRAWHSAKLLHSAEWPLGEQTVPAAQALEAVRQKIDDYFARSRVAAYDPQAAAPLSPSRDDYAALSLQTLAMSSEGIAALPLASLSASGFTGALPLLDGVNPAWAPAMAAFQSQTVAPLLGADQTQLTEAQWQALQKALASCLQWLRDKPETPLNGWEGEAAFSKILHGDVQQRVMNLLARDEHEQVHNTRTHDLERLLRYKRDLLKLLNNFVSFSAFYQREGAIFQAGTLYLDARSCDLTVHVTDPAQHAKLAGLAKTYLAYCDCQRKTTDESTGKAHVEKMHMVVAFTAGDVDFLFIGRNGVFYDRKGRDWDATITKLIENPTSIGQAFFSPYKKFLRLIEEQVAKRAAASDSRLEKTMGTTAGSLVNTDLKTTAAPLANVDVTRRTDVGTVAALGVALGSISAVLVGIFAKFVDLGAWIPLALLGIVLAISGPSMLIAWLKLRQRSLGPILDASGWAINGRMRINTRLGGSLSQTAHVPATARRMLNDPFAETTNPWWYGLLGVAILASAAFMAWRWWGV